MIHWNLKMNYVEYDKKKFNYVILLRKKVFIRYKTVGYLYTSVKQLFGSDS